MGQRLLHLKNETWRGVSNSNATDRGGRQWLKLENVYVSHDGQELRHFPGFYPLLDLTRDAAPGIGYDKYVVEAAGPVFSTSPGEVYQTGYGWDDSRLITLYGRALPVHFHGFEQIQDQILIWGESRFVENAIFTAARNICVISSISVVGGRWTLTLSDTPDLDGSSTDATGAGMNGLSVPQVVYIESDLAVADAAVQAFVETNLRGRVHEIYSISGATVTLFTTSAATATNEAVTVGGEINTVRFNRNRGYSTPSGMLPYDEDVLKRPDDPDALTVWRVLEPLDRTDIAKDAYPAWVANRRRDHGDAMAGDAAYHEGVGYEVTIAGTTYTRGLSRREKRALPYRTNADSATDRVILAAPGYGCMFQIPVKTAANPDQFPASPTNGSYGIPHPENDQYDQPRSLGIPKARMVESTYTPAAASPGDFTNSSFAAFPAVGSPDFGIAAGTYWVAISYYDSAMDEEGLASEPIEIEIPSNNYAYTLNIPYIHPGYIMPECLADRINVYVAPVGEEALAFYGSFPLQNLPYRDWAAGANLTEDASGKYGFTAPCTPSDPFGIIRQLALPLPDDNSSISEKLDPERLAPQSASMPRGSDACRYIRGVLFAGGNIGNQGGSLQLWETRASMSSGSSTFSRDDMVYFRTYGGSLTAPSNTTDVDSTTSQFGIGGRAFPDAYGGLTFQSRDLVPGGWHSVQVDRVLNRRAPSLTAGTWINAAHDRVSTVHPLLNRFRTAGSPATTNSVENLAAKIWWQMPRGQIQIGDPGAPYRSQKSAIQIIDPNRGDDITAIGNFAGTAILCTQKETYSYAWFRNASSEIPNIVNNEHGCIAANSMCEFDGGLAWIGQRGPVAIGGAGLQFVGIDVQEWFVGQNRRYLTDSKGMMRHTWSCHDASRGLVMWGMVTEDSEFVIAANGDTYSSRENGVSFAEANDQQRSRCACDEVLIWSYRANAFSTWRPPTGFEVLWMRPIRDADGHTKIAFLCGDGRIYALDDEAFDMCIEQDVFVEPTAAGTGTSLTITGSTIYPYNSTAANGALMLRPGALVEVLNERDQVVAESTVASFASPTITLTSSISWKTSASGWRVRIAGRQRATLISAYLGAEGFENLHAQAVHMRYDLRGTGNANAKVSLFRTGREDRDATISGATEVLMTQADRWAALGNVVAATDLPVSRRIVFNNGDATAPEIGIKILLSGTAQTRIQDIAVEIEP